MIASSFVIADDVHPLLIPASTYASSRYSGRYCDLRIGVPRRDSSRKGTNRPGDFLSVTVACEAEQKQIDSRNPRAAISRRSDSSGGESDGFSSRRSKFRLIGNVDSLHNNWLS